MTYQVLNYDCLMVGKLCEISPFWPISSITPYIWAWHWISSNCKISILFFYNAAPSKKRLNWMPNWPLIPPPLRRHRAAVILFEQGTSKVLCTKSIGSNASQVRSFWQWSMITYYSPIVADSKTFVLVFFVLWITV